MSSELAPAISETEPKNRRTLWRFFRILLIALLCLGAGWHFYHQSKTPPKPVVRIIFAPDTLAEDGLILGFNEIIIYPNRSFLSGSHPTVTFHGTAHSDKEKIKYAQFAYSTKKHPQRHVVDATRREGDDFFVKIRDLEPGDVGVCHFVATTRRGKHVSQPVTFRIPEK